MPAARRPSSTTWGRDDALSSIDALLDRAASRLGVLLIEGAPGMGKTRLVEEAVGRADDRGFAVLASRAERIGLSPPFWSIADALGCRAGGSDPRRQEIVSALAAAPADPVSAGGFQFRLVDAFTDLVESEALRRPALLLLDDAHRADHPTLLALRTIIRRLPTLPLAVIVSYRGSEADAALAGFIEASSAEGAGHLVLAPLDSGSVTSVIADLLGADVGPLLLEQASAAGGNPLFVKELVAALGTDGRIQHRRGTADIAELSPSPSLRLAVLRRVGQLSRPAEGHLRMAAVLGLVFGVADLGVATGASVVELLPSVEEWRRADLVGQVESNLRFRHDLVRDVVYDDIPEAVRAELHAEIAARLADAGGSAVSVADHVLLAGRSDASAVDWLRRAASDMSSHDPATAVDLLRRALAIVPAEEASWDAMRVELATLLAYSSRPAEAEDLVRDILARDHSPELEDDLRSLLVHSLFVRGRWRDVTREVELAATGSTVSTRGRARLLAESTLARIWVGDVDGAARDGEEALRLGESIGDTASMSFALSHLSAVADMRGQFLTGVTLARQAVEMAGGLLEVERRHPQLSYGMALLAADRLRDAKDALQESRLLAERNGTVWDLSLNHAMLALPMLYLGEWDDALTEASAALASADETGVTVGRVAALSVIAAIAVHRDELAAAREALATAEGVIRDHGPQWGMLWFGLARAEVLEAEGDADGRLRVLDELWRDATLEGRYRIGPDHVRAALVVGHREVAAEVSRELAATVAPDGVAYAQAAILQCEGLVAAEPDLLLRAVEVLHASGRVPAIAAATADAAVALADEGRLDEARSCFGAAVTAFASLSATRDVARVAACARRAGIHRGVHAAHTRATTGWDALTPTEEEVVRLAAQGLTNPQIGDRLFISRRTVQTHLSHVYVKLGLASRVELAAAVARRDH